MSAPAQTSPVLTAPEIAALLRITPAQFTSRRYRLERNGGFPRPLPSLPGRWSRALVEQWLAAGPAQQHRQPATACAGAVTEPGSPQGPAPASHAPGNIVDMETMRQRRVLEQTYGVAHD